MSDLVLAAIDNDTTEITTLLDTRWDCFSEDDYNVSILLADKHANTDVKTSLENKKTDAANTRIDSLTLLNVFAAETDLSNGIIESLILGGANPNAYCNVSKKTPLDYAVKKANTTVVDTLFSHNAKVSVCECKNSLFFSAIESGISNLVSSLITNCDPALTTDEKDLYEKYARDREYDTIADLFI